MSRTALTTPRAAAVAGIVFGISYGASLVLVNIAIPVDKTADRAWVEANAHWVYLALSLVPYAGIAFLWFIGVIRDRLGGLEDRFFATIFLGSGLLFVALSFIGAALAGGLLSSYEAERAELTTSGAYTYGRAVLYNVVDVKAIRMAGVFMASLATIWMRTAFDASSVAFRDIRSGAGLAVE